MRSCSDELPPRLVRPYCYSIVDFESVTHETILKRAKWFLQSDTPATGFRYIYLRWEIQVRIIFNSFDKFACFDLWTFRIYHLCVPALPGVALIQISAHITLKNLAGRKTMETMRTGYAASGTRSHIVKGKRASFAKNV